MDGVQSRCLTWAPTRLAEERSGKRRRPLAKSTETRSETFTVVLKPRRRPQRWLVKPAEELFYMTHHFYRLDSWKELEV